MSKDQKELQAEVQAYLREMALRKKEIHEEKRNKTTTEVAVRNELFSQELETLYKAHPFPKAQPYKGKSNKKTERILNLMLSDLHYGSDLGLHETGYKYGALEEARRTAAVVAAAADWKRQYRSETVLNVHLLGDIIQGKLHDPEAAAPLTEQVFRAIWNLGQALRFLASEFKFVHVRTSPGNHGRRKDRHPDRAVNQKWDSIENMIYGGLKMHLLGIPNLQFDIPLKPYYTYPAFDKVGFMTHGDTVLNVGFPGRAIQVESVRKQVNEINNVEHADLFGVGHVHVASNTRLPNGVVLITNGCLTPSDEYAQSIGIIETACSQQIWESVPGIIFGHRMDVFVDSNTDKMTDMDRIVKPYPGTAEFGLLRAK
jgi:hypothetical protein